MSYNRQFVSQQLILEAAKIPASLCFGREGKNDSNKDFILAFFVTRSDDELREISDFVTKNYKEEEVLVSFFFKKSNGNSYTLSSDEMKSFDFKKWPYKLSKLCTSWDELREIDQAIMGITFTLD
ncbi:MAG: hypothetical protein U0M00_00435 [Clostridia bacterium]|jgi:hypothetical protein|nr:hypothetical protein [Clostridia bacterium]